MDGKATAMESFPQVDACGSPYQRGRQHGAAVPERIARSASRYRRQLARHNVCAERQAALALGMRPAIERFDPGYLEEMQGIADGAGVPLEDVILINCAAELLFAQGELSAICKELDDRGASLAVLPENAAGERLMHAHHSDWREERLDTAIVLRIRRGGGQDEPDLLMFTGAGCLARHGFNNAGVSLTGSFLGSDRDYRKMANVPLALVRRKMLEAPSMSAAMKLLWQTQRFCSGNLMLAQARVRGDGQHVGNVVSLECAPDEIFWLTPQHGLLVHANHWLCPVARSRLRGQGLAVNPDSLFRQQRAETALLHAINQGPGKISWAMVKNVLADDFPDPGGAFLNADAGYADGRSAAAATILIDAASRTMRIAACKPCQPLAFVEYRL